MHPARDPVGVRPRAASDGPSAPHRSDPGHRTQLLDVFGAGRVVSEHLVPGDTMRDMSTGRGLGRVDDAKQPPVALGPHQGTSLLLTVGRRRPRHGGAVRASPTGRPTRSRSRRITASMAVIEDAPAEAIPTPLPELTPPSPSRPASSPSCWTLSAPRCPNSTICSRCCGVGHRSRRVGSLFQWSRSNPGRRTRHGGMAVRRSLRGLPPPEIRSRFDQAGLREPEITTSDVHSYLTEGPTAEPATDNYPAWISEP